MEGFFAILFLLLGFAGIIYVIAGDTRNQSACEVTGITVFSAIAILCFVGFATSSPNSQVEVKQKAAVEIFSKPSGSICYDNLYRERSYTSSHKFVVFPIPPRYPRKGLAPTDLAHAHLLITYKECYCFEPQTEKGWEYLETCRKYFSDLDTIYDNFAKIKKEL